VRVGCVSLHPHVHAGVPGVPGQRLGFRSRPVLRRLNCATAVEGKTSSPLSRVASTIRAW
jgi:hypothetical protein